MLTVTQVAERLNLSKQSVYALVDSGDLASHRFGKRRGSIRISEADLEAYITASRQEKVEKPIRRTSRPRLKHISLPPSGPAPRDD
jgi:excisionase family DNA binding protein